ncbi:hypothetical protein ES703_67337 [subsurface metagenome]
MKILKWVITTEKKLDEDFENFVQKEVKLRIRFIFSRWLWSIFPLIIWGFFTIFLLRRFPK